MIRLPPLLIALMFCLTSCYSVKYLNTKEELNRNIDAAIVYLNDLGYHQNGVSLDTKNELVVTGVSYSSTTGYGTRMNNNYVYNDRYSFVNSEGNTIEFTVSYQTWLAERDTIVKYDTYDTIIRVSPGYQDIGGYRPPVERKVVRKQHHEERPYFMVVGGVSVSQCKASTAADFRRICNSPSPVSTINAFVAPQRARVKK